MKNKHAYRNKRGQYKSYKWLYMKAFLILALTLTAWLYNHAKLTEEEAHLKQLRQQFNATMWEYQALEAETIENSWTIHEPEKWKPKASATVTAYSCGGLETPEQIAMNCPFGVARWTNKPPIPGVTVACASHLKMKRILIDGIGERVCEDTGGAINGHDVDLYVEDVKLANSFGVQQLEVTYLD